MTAGGSKQQQRKQLQQSQKASIPSFPFSSLHSPSRSQPQQQQPSPQEPSQPPGEPSYAAQDLSSPGLDKRATRAARIVFTANSAAAAARTYALKGVAALVRALLFFSLFAAAPL